VIGGGIFGVTAALELTARDHQVTLVDPGPIPHPLAESTDLSKAVRCDYGDDLEYTMLGERALEGWRRWNAAWPVPRFHETGVAFLARRPIQPGGFEHDSLALLSRRGHRIERLDAATIPRRFPAYRPGAFVDGYFHAEGGWAEAAAVVAGLVALVRAAGATIRERITVDRIEPGGAFAGATWIAADRIVVCAGSWTTLLLPELATTLRAVAQPVFHFRPRDPALFDASRFPVFGADISRTGYYGFPVTQGIVKIANHGAGRSIDPATRRLDADPEASTATTGASADQEAAVTELVRDVFPDLTAVPIASRLCVYGDTLDGHFLIAPHPGRPEVVIAAGGSGHAFKFAPVLGPVIADAVEGKVEPRFAWRSPAAGRGDAARHQ